MKNNNRLHRMMTKQERDAEREKPGYPKNRQVNWIKAFTSRDFLLSLFYFFGFQGTILLLMFATKFNNPMFIYGSMFLSIILSGLGLWTAISRQKIKYRARRFNLIKTLFHVLLTYVGIMLISFLLHFADITPTVQPNQESLNLLMEQYFVPVTIITGIVAPIVEELVFRELLPFAFGPSKVSFIISSVIFTLLHAPAGITGYIVYTYLTIVFLAIRMKQDNLISAIFTHMGYNMLTTLITVFILS